MEEDTLTGLGLSRNEARTYLALVRLGMSTASAVIESTGLHRANVYDTLEKLHKKGLISSIIKVNVKQYQAAPPNKLLDILKEKEQNIQQILPRLEADFKASKSKEEIQVFKGKNGLKTVLEDILKEDKTWYVFGGAGRLSEYLKFHIMHWNRQREKQKMDIKIIYDNSLRGRKEELRFMEKRYVKSRFNFPAGVGIYGDKVVQIIFGDEPLIILIRSEKAAKGFMEYFQLLWNASK